MTRAMKDSGIEWIGEIPEEWEVKRTRFIANSMHKGNGITKEQVVSDGDSPCVRYGEIYSKYNISFSECKTRTNKSFYATLQYFSFGDILFACTGELPEEIGKNIAYLGNENCLAGGDIIVMKHSQEPRFLSYVYNSYGQTQKSCGKTKLKVVHISAPEIANIVVALPPLPEQQQIADFLDDKVSQIDSTISKTRESIEEYKKLKQSIITEAVTKGIRGDRPMKDSGVEWIGEIPADWEVKRTKFIANSMHKGNGITKEQIVSDGDSPCVRYGEIYSKYNISFSECKTRTNKSFYATLQYFSFGDILFACTGELSEEIGKNIAYLGNENCLAGGDIIVMKHSQEPRFLSYVYNSYGQTQKSCGKTKLKVVHISAPEIANIVVALPPLSEQQQIADYLDKKCSEIDSLITKKEQLVVELGAYKKSLIYEVVTGKRCV